MDRDAKGRFFKGCKFSEETKKKMSEARKGNQYRLGSKASEETLKKLSLCRLGEKNHFYGKHLSEEHRKKLSEAHKGKKKLPCTDETKRKIGLAVKGEKNGNFGKRGELSSTWKGGKVKTKYGYILIHKPEHPFATADGYVLEHRLVMEKFLGRYLLPEEVVHHINGIKDDNRIENLMLFDNNNKHQKYHKQLKKALVV